MLFSLRKSGLLAAGADSIEHASYLTDDVIELAKERGTPFVMQGGAVYKQP